MMHHATKRGFKDCPGFLNSTGRLGPKRGWKCHVTPAFSGSPTKGTKSEVKTYAGGHHDAPPTKRGFKDCPRFLNSTGRLGPKRGRKCYVTRAFSGVPKKATKLEVKTHAGGHHDAPRNKAWIVPVSSIAPEGWGPKEVGNATSPLHSQGFPTKETKSEVKTYAGGYHDALRNKAWIQRLSRIPQWHRKVGAQKRAEMLRHPCILGGPQKGDEIRSQNLCRGSP